MRHPNYDRNPFVPVPDADNAAVQGWDAITHRLGQRLNKQASVLVVECYCGVDEQRIIGELSRRLRPALLIHARQAMLPPGEIESLVKPFLGGDDPVFGYLCGLKLPQFFDQTKVAALRQQVRQAGDGLVLIVGCGASLIDEGGLLVYADLARWEAQNRFRRNQASNLGVDNTATPASLQYKRAFFVDWRVCDRWKRPLIGKWDFVLDTNSPAQPKLADGDAVRRGLKHAAHRPLRVVPFFDPAPWGGQWMKHVCNLPAETDNYGWCFDCVPEENSLLLGFGDLRLEIPSINLVFDQPRALLGEAVHARFGDEFPIRFDFLDTMQGGNLSFQVHPTTAYIQQEFGMHYTQDESYYLLDAGQDACVYLGLKEGIDRQQLIADLEAAQPGGKPFNADRYANRWPAKKHDHFLIPAGTVHCSGANAMVLEISATPYIFTFKLWDWGRLGLDGEPRPIHINHGKQVIHWDRTTSWVKRSLINQIDQVTRGKGWREERTGLHHYQFIETRRHWFTGTVGHYTRGGVNVLNLVEGEEAIVESPLRQFDPFIVHYAETFIVPAAVGPYTIRPHGPSAGKQCGTIKACVRA